MAIVEYDPNLGDVKEDEIISKRSLCAVLEIIDYLKENVEEEGMFRFAGRAHTRRKILISLRRGDLTTLRHYLDGATIECAAALQMYLTHLREPLIPRRVQQLVLAENPGIPERTVANDALGLLRQDLSGRHLKLLRSLLELLHAVTKKHPKSELKGCLLPVALLPVFFELKPHCVARWKKLAATFNELINKAPTWLEKGNAELEEETSDDTATTHTGSVHSQDPRIVNEFNIEREGVPVTLSQQNRRFLRGEPSDRRSLTSLSMIPLVFFAQTQRHPFLRSFS